MDTLRNRMIYVFRTICSETDRQCISTADITAAINDDLHEGLGVSRLLGIGSKPGRCTVKQVEEQMHTFGQNGVGLIRENPVGQGLKQFDTPLRSCPLTRQH